MFSRTLHRCCAPSGVGHLPSARELRKQLADLKAKQRAIRRVRRDLRRASALPFFSTAASPSAASSSSSSFNGHSGSQQARGTGSWSPIGAYDLPGNPELEASVRDFIANGRDARDRLDVLSGLLGGSILYGLGSPVGPFDTLDVRPQPFVFDAQHVATPVFSSLPLLQSFCGRFGYTVRGPDTRVWGTPDSPTEPLLQIDRSPSSTTASNNSSGTPSRKRRRKGSKRAAHHHEPASIGGDERESADLGSRYPGGPTAQAAADALWRRQAASARREQEKQSRRAMAQAASVESLGYQAATPLPVYGAFDRPFFWGFFGETKTLLDQISAVPMAGASQPLDVVLNPASPLELALGFQTAEALINPELILTQCMRDVMRVVQGEFRRFLRASCPEVTGAVSSLLPVSNSSSGRPSYLPEFDLVIGLRSAEFGRTMATLAQAKDVGALRAHASVKLLPAEALPDHADAVSVLFYDPVGEEWPHSSSSSKGGLTSLGEGLLLDAEPTGWGGERGDIGMEFGEAHNVYFHQKNMEARARRGLGVASQPSPAA